MKDCFNQVPENENSLEWVRERLRHRYALEKFYRAREELDPKNILVNDVISKLLPQRQTEVIRA